MELDISNKLTNEEHKIKIDKDHSYVVDRGKNTAIKIMHIDKEKDLDEFAKNDKVIKLALGEDAFNYIDSKNYPISQINTIVEAIMAVITEIPFETIVKEAEKSAKHALNTFQK